MAPDVMETLLKLPSHERADLAMALWESLDETDRERCLGFHYSSDVSLPPCRSASTSCLAFV